MPRNPGPGGWGASLRFIPDSPDDAQQVQKDLYGFQAEATNNQMELMAVIQGLESLKRSCPVKIYTDSKYVLDGITKWMANWKLKGWKTAAKKPVKMSSYGNVLMLLCNRTK